MKKRFVILDGSSLLYRAFYALPLLTAANGAYTNAVYGFSTMLLKLLQALSPDLLVVAFDKGKKTFRNDLFEAYKGTRKPTPMELSSQIPLLHELMEAWGISFIEMAGFEADDIIGTLASQAAEADFDTLVVTGDRDALQLIRPNLRVMLTKRGISDMDTFDADAFQEVYGLKPIQLIDLKGLMGDASDNIPGVPGVGQKTASKLLAAYGSLENVLDHTEEIAGTKLKERLRENRDIALLSKQLATIDCNIPVEFGNELYKIQPDYNKVQDFCQRYGMSSVLKGFKRIFHEAELPFEPAKEVALPAYFMAEGMQESREFAVWVRQIGHFSFSGTYEGQVPWLRLEGAAVSCDGRIAYFSANTPAWSIFQDLLQDDSLEKNSYDLKRLYHVGQKITGKVLDIELAAYLVEPASGTYGLARLLAEFCPEEAVPSIIRAPAEAAVWEAYSIERLGSGLHDKLRTLELELLYENVEFPLIEVLASMEQTGVYVNRNHLQAKALEVAGRIEKLQEEIYVFAGEKFNINSPKQLGEVLFGKLQLPVIKKTKSGYSTNAEVLEELRFSHPIIEKILSYRLWSKLKSTYLDSINMLIDERTQRVHTHFNQAVTATGRLSSSDPNLQNIPVRTEEGKQIRTLFEPGEGYDCLLSADYSQIELRILASLSQDKNFVEAFRKDEDIHTRTASEVFDVPMDEVTSELRRRAKAVNFGIVYGISDYGLSRDLHISRKEAAGYIESYFKKCSGIKHFIDKVVADAHQDGYVKTILGRRRELPALRSTNYNQRTLAERMAMNTPIQGSAADIIKLAMISAYRRLKKAKVHSRILLQVHDELVLEVVENERALVSEILKDTMENIVEMSVPLRIDINAGKNWAEAK